MIPPEPFLAAVSGTRGKGPACFLVETGKARLLLDPGYGPQPGLLPELARAFAPARVTVDTPLTL